MMLEPMKRAFVSQRVSVRVFAAGLCALICCVSTAFAQRAETGWEDPGSAMNSEADGQQPRPERNPVPPALPINKGFVILEGRYVPPPYKLERDDAGLRVNGTLVELRAGRSSGNGSGQTPGGGRGGMGNPLGRVEKNLREGGLLLELEAGPTMALPSHEALWVLTVLLDESASKESKVDSLMSLDLRVSSSGQWAQLIDTFEPPRELRDRVSALGRQQEEADQTTRDAHASRVTRARVVGLLSIMLATCGLGVVFTHLPPRGAGWRGIDDSKEALRRVLVLICSLVILNIFDLACTLIAAAGGGFHELNPLIAPHVSNPTAVIAFKGFFLATGISLLMAFRRHRFAQLAAWGLALFYAVAVLRWATYGSTFLW